MNWQDRIVGTPGTCGGRPRIDGTRITVEFLLGLKAAGWSDTQILDGYPHLKAEDLQAAFAYAMSILEDESILPVAHVG